MVKIFEFWRTRLSETPLWYLQILLHYNFFYIYAYPENFMTVSSLSVKKLLIWEGTFKGQPDCVAPILVRFSTFLIYSHFEN